MEQQTGIDKNYVTGIVLIVGLFIVYFWFIVPKTVPVDQTIINDSTYVPVDKSTPLDSKGTQLQIAASTQIKSQDTFAEQYRRQYGEFAFALNGKPEDIIIENKNVKIIFNTKGGKIKEVMLKKYKTYDQKPLILIDEQSSTMDIEFQTNLQTINLGELYFKTDDQNPGIVKGQSKSVRFRLTISSGQYIEQTYTLPAEGYLLDYDLKFIGIDNLVKNEPIRFTWIDKLKKLEQDLTSSRNYSSLNYYSSKNGFSEIGGGIVGGCSRSDNGQIIEQIHDPLKWITMKQRFFSAAFITENHFSNAELSSYNDLTDSNTVKTLMASFDIPIEELKTEKGKFKFYFGPINYKILKKIAKDDVVGFDNNIYLGWPVVSWFNKILIIPIFNFLERFINSYGLIILFLVLIIKTLLFPLTYKSYISMGKMRVLKPETDAIKEKYKDDMKAAQQEQMKLFQNVGVNPLSGCIPMLAQMPIVMAMFFFFPNAIELRQESFLWAHDLSTYDSIYDFPAGFSIPYYGSHISLFTILMTISTLVYTYINSQSMSSQMQGPMKTMQYIMPVMFLVILNSFSAALTYYYFLQSLITIAQQMIIRRFVDDEKIKQKLDDYKLKKTTKKKSGIRQRIDAAIKGKSDNISFKEKYYQEMRKKKDKK